MKRLASILMWSAVSAAFIGPGTVTTASRAGATFGLSLLWAVLFSTVACLALQEASARITVAGGTSLGQVIRSRYGRRRWLPFLVVGAVVFGCVAYQMGNLLGAVAGLALQLGLPRWILTAAVGAVAGVILLAGSVQAVARLLGLVVALMGVAFFVCAVRLGPSLTELGRSLLIPTLPPEAGVLALGLVGTTVVPYNLFLGSGLARGRPLSEARLGLAVAVPLGGLITMAVLVVGTAVQGEFGFDSLASALRAQLGPGADLLFAFGLLAAGLSSAITAPLAAALSVRGFLGHQADEQRWGDRGRSYRFVWAGVLLVGLVFALTDVQPIPAIILAQALNGVILPLVAVILLLAVNDISVVGRDLLSGPFNTFVLGVSVLVSCVLGAAGTTKAVCSALSVPAPSQAWQLGIGGLVALALAPVVIGRIRTGRKADTPVNK